jgi:hypothetical protein
MHGLMLIGDLPRFSIVQLGAIAELASFFAYRAA